MGGAALGVALRVRVVFRFGPGVAGATRSARAALTTEPMFAGAAALTSLHVAFGRVRVRDRHEDVEIALIEQEVAGAPCATTSPGAATATITAIATSPAIAAPGVASGVSTMRSCGAVASMSPRRAVAPMATACMHHDVSDVVERDEIA